MQRFAWKVGRGIRTGQDNLRAHVLLRPSRRGWLLIVLALLLVIIWQFAYPRDRALPLARLDGHAVGAYSRASLEAKLTKDYNNVPITLYAGDKSDTTTADAVGIRVNVEATTGALLRYSWWQRLIPFSLLVRGALTNQPVVSTIDTKTFESYADVKSRLCVVTPQNAGVTLQSNGKLAVRNSVPGKTCPVSSFKKAFADLPLHQSNTTVHITPETVQADITEKNVTDAMLKKAQNIADTNLQFVLDGQQLTVPKKDIVSWLYFTDDDAKVAVNTDTMQAYLKDAESLVYIEPGTTQITRKNGMQIVTKTGTTGRGIDLAATAQDLADTLLAGGGTVTAELLTLQPTFEYSEPYSADEAGLRQLLQELVNTKGEYAVSIRKLDGTVTADVNGTKGYHPASTYKMYAAWAVLQRIAAGTMHWSDYATGGMTVSQCFDTMIVNSNNECGEYFGRDVIGWATLDKLLRGIGLTCTDVSPPGWYSCANDETLFLYKLQAGELLEPELTQRLLGVMRRQVYRDGIPAGESAAVADKVGFLYGYLHDAGIVYSPHGTYALTVLTNGSSWGDIADVAAQVDAQLARMVR